jgi:hypothetical protein
MTDTDKQAMETAVQKAENAVPTDMVVSAGFGTASGFDLLLRQAKWMSSSDLVPKEFRNNVANCVIALEMAQRMNASPLAVIQNIYIVHGKPSWSAQFITAAVNSTGRFSPLRFKEEGEGSSRRITAWAVEKATGEKLYGPPVDIAMAKAEGWFDKAGSKWKTMPELMLRYRAATFFGRLYAPEVLMGMQTMDEIEDTVDLERDENGIFSTPSDSLSEKTTTKAEVIKDKIRKHKVPKGPVVAEVKEVVVPPAGCPYEPEGEAKRENCVNEDCFPHCEAWNEGKKEGS